MPLVEIPEIGDVEFPDSMSSADVAAASGRLYAEKKLPPIPQPLLLPPAPPNTPEGRRLSAMLAGEPVRPEGPGFLTDEELAGIIAPVTLRGGLSQRLEEEIDETLIPGVKTAVPESPLAPTLTLPRYEGQPTFPGEKPSKILEVGGGLYNALASAAESLTSPASAATLGAVGLGKGIERLATGIWAVFMGSQVPEQVQEARKAFKEGKPLSEKVEKTLAPIISATFTSTAGKQAIAPSRPLLTPEQIARAQEQARQSGLPSQEPLPSETPTPPQQPRVAPIEAPKAPETVAPTRPAVEGEVREPVAPTAAKSAKLSVGDMIGQVGENGVDAALSYFGQDAGIDVALRGGRIIVPAADRARATGIFTGKSGGANRAFLEWLSSDKALASHIDEATAKDIAKLRIALGIAEPARAAGVPEKPNREFSQREQDKIDDALSDAEVTTNEILERDPAYQKEQGRVTAFEEEIADMEKIAADRNNPDRKSAASRVNELEADLEQIQKGIQRIRQRTLADERQKAWDKVTAKMEPEESPSTTKALPTLKEALIDPERIGASVVRGKYRLPGQQEWFNLHNERPIRAYYKRLSEGTAAPIAEPAAKPLAELPPSKSRIAETVARTPEPAISFPGIGSLREKQATAMELGKIRKNEPELWKAITQMFGTDQPAKIARLAKQRMEEGKIPPPDVERRAMLAGSHIAGIPDPIALAFAVTFGTKTGRQVVGDAVRFYSEPLSERLATEGGTNSKGFSNMAKEISQRAKELYGSLTGVLDPALEATGKMNRTTTWLNDIAPTKKRWGFRNAQTAVEGTIENVPAEHRATVQLLKAANLRIGQLAEPVVEGFKATGRYQRPPTDFLIDTIRSGQGQAFDVVKNALAAENKIHPEKVKKILRGIKEELDAPGSEQTVHRIAQEFERHFRKFPTDIRITTPLGEVWMPILHAKPFEYLQNAATRTAQRVSFLERVPKGTLLDIRKAVVSELKSPEAFDDLVRALHGLPVNQPLRFFAPGSLQSMIAQGANRVLSDVFGTLKLTASAIYNIPETVLGNTPAFFGWHNFARGAVGLKERWAKLEELGAINRAIYNFSFDPKAPVRSVLNDFRLGVRKATMQQFFNEMQEMLAASTAQVFAERASGKLLSQREQGLFTETAVAMGFTRPAARAMAEGRGSPEQYGRFTQRAAAFSTGGNIQPAELSRFGGNRVLTSLFRFQSYPMMKLNAFRKAYMNFTEAVESKDPRRIKASSEQLAKFLFGTTAQGAAAVFLAALLSGRGGGVEQTAQEAEDNPGKFIFDSLAGGMGGPVSAINYVVGTGKSRDLLNPKNINAGITFPGSIYLELKQLFNTEGPYAGMTMPNAIQKYLQTRVPAGKMVRHAFEEAGLVSDSETARGNLYRLHQDWLRRNPDPKIQADFERQQALVLPESKYAGVLAAMRARDEDGLKKAVAELQSSGAKLSDIKKRFEPRTQDGRQKQIFHESEALERKFRESLTAAQRNLYEAAVKERQAQWDWFRRFY